MICRVILFWDRVDSPLRTLLGDMVGLECVQSLGVPDAMVGC